MTHEIFLERLKDLGIELSIVSNDKSNIIFDLYVNGLLVSGSKYSLFGYFRGGCYNSCSRSKQIVFNEEDVFNATQESIKIMKNEIYDLKFKPDYHVFKNYLKSFFNDKKIDRDSQNRVFNLIKENYNDLLKWRKNKHL